MQCPCIDHLDHPADMWHILRERLDTAASSMGKKALYQAFTNLRPIPGKPIGDYFAELPHIRNEITGTAEAIPDEGERLRTLHTNHPASADAYTASTANSNLNNAQPI